MYLLQDVQNYNRVDVSSSRCAKKILFTMLKLNAQITKLTNTCFDLIMLFMYLI
ncbi:hypothetical protein Hanom_Chr12g01092171 [Helianthus anomalus]